MATRVLAADQSVARRPFTSISLFQRDLAILAYLTEDLRALLAQMAAGTVNLIPYQSNEWQVHGLKRRAIVTNAMGLYNRRTVCVVGFFGERHLERDHTPLEEANAEIVLEFKNYPGILSYCSMELPDGNWANLVLHDIPQVREYWRASERHARAAQELSPLYYRTVRIHNGVLPGGLMSGRPIAIERTKFWDYRNPRVWHAVRELTVRQSEGLAH
ncbi:MAG TPA: hypothetical protein VJR05_09815 [Acidimicrobiia bacterium]|nr:hypothetical protein [Acidimicrobiia bacterium]